MKILLLQVLLIFLCAANTTAVYAQCATVPIPLPERIAKTKYIILGEITEQHCYEDKDGNIYTLNKAAVHAWAKSAQSQPYIYVITYGGVLGNKAQITTPSLQLTLHEQYMIMLADDNKVVDDKNTRSTSPYIIQAFAYAGTQGAMLYQENQYIDASSGLKMDEQQLLKTIFSITTENAKTPDNTEYTGNKEEGGTAKLLTPTIDNFSPNPTNAGTIEPADFLTITGSNFGNKPGKVEFKNADDGGNTYITVTDQQTDYVSWSDNSITVKVPPKAGTGTIRVNGKTSTQVLGIKIAFEDLYSKFYQFDDTTRQRFYLRELSDSIGYIFTYNTTSGFSTNNDAKAAFERAMTTWKCKTGINWKASGETSNGFADDGLSVVMFDNSLDAGTLGTTTYRLSGGGSNGCSLVNTVWYLKEADMRFAKVPTTGYTWQFGPALPNSKQFDFESVTVHELGHAHGLGHRIAPGEVMNYNITNGTALRVPSTTEFEGAQTVMNYSTVPTCFDPTGSGTPMIVASCVLPVQILAFKAELQNQNVLLSWKTVSEYNADYFTIQRSVDGVHFTDINTVNAINNNTSINQYHLTDNISSMVANTIYYRLKETDKDGKTTLSDISMVTIGGKILMVYPNPAKTFVKVTGQSIAFIEVLDGNGKAVFKKQVSNENVTTINISSLSSGVYMLLIKDNKGNTDNRKLVIE